MGPTPLEDVTATRTTSAQLTILTSRIVSAYLTHNRIATEGLPGLIEQVHRALAGAIGGTSMPTMEKQEPAVPIRKSVLHEYIVCLEDGKKLKMLKRHLRSAYGMTLQQYREKWGLPANYPMVAPAYANRRSELARQVGLGRKLVPAVKVSRLPARRAKGSKG